jgi:hypothetical protein
VQSGFGYAQSGLGDLAPALSARRAQQSQPSPEGTADDPLARDRHVLTLSQAASKSPPPAIPYRGLDLADSSRSGARRPTFDPAG